MSWPRTVLNRRETVESPRSAEREKRMVFELGQAGFKSKVRGLASLRIRMMAKGAKCLRNRRIEVLSFHSYRIPLDRIERVMPWNLVMNPSGKIGVLAFSFCRKRLAGASSLGRSRISFRLSSTTKGHVMHVAHSLMPHC